MNSKQAYELRKQARQHFKDGGGDEILNRMFSKLGIWNLDCCPYMSEEAANSKKVVIIRGCSMGATVKIEQRLKNGKPVMPLYFKSIING